MLKRFWIWGGLLTMLLLWSSWGGDSARADEGFTLRVGESLTYKIYYGAIPAGSQTMKVVEKTVYRGREAYRIQMEMSTASAVKMIYTYKETEEILLDAKGFYPLYGMRRVKKKNKETEQETVFSMEKKEITVRTVRNGNENIKVIPFDKPCQNGLSLYYYLRTRPWERGKWDLLLLTKDGIESFSYRVTHIERHQSAMGTFDADSIENASLGYVLKFSKDARVLPLQVEVDGKFDSRLVQVN